MSITGHPLKDSTPNQPVDIKLLYTFNGPNAHQTVRLINEVAQQLCASIHIDKIKIDDNEVATKYHFHGSPTVLVNNHDIDPLHPDDSKISFQSRMYGQSGVPKRKMIFEAIQHALNINKLP